MPIKTRGARVRADDTIRDDDVRDDAMRDNTTGDDTGKDNTRDVLQANIEILPELVRINIIVGELLDKIVNQDTTI